MAVEWQLVVDCADPVALSLFWARAMEYEPEDNTVLIDRLLAEGLVKEEDLREVDGRKVFATVVAIRHPDDPVDGSTGIGLGRRVLFQVVPESKTVKNRLHVDLKVGPARRADTVRRLEGLGATFVRAVDEPGAAHVTMRDPEGNEFDVQ
ncbi:VOC family protein [Nocardiopsis tropica]|jgi:catechol 2,3-dioxygenase-like lactoylglutathione lyase family enzyme|uniref:VOC family protein n=1 Tax=Nocardiopsis tropica TaxID=109330 RepID=A0ABU7KU66_9ACTN|nr:VOC family protein [Nocardiopsis umidischolae]MEE2052833.1 VOC family protein [Nocardiopsis umidischolae]